MQTRVVNDVGSCIFATCRPTLIFRRSSKVTSGIVLIKTNKGPPSGAHTSNRRRDPLDTVRHLWHRCQVSQNSSRTLYNRVTTMLTVTYLTQPWSESLSGNLPETVRWTSTTSRNARTRPPRIWRRRDARWRPLDDLTTQDRDLRPTSLRKW